LLRCTIDARRQILTFVSKFLVRRPTLTLEIPHMSIQAHLAELLKRHQALDSEIAEALQHPSVDDLRIAELKRRKLQVKDEIERLRGNSTSIH
jgi:hypothetical protein